MKRLLSIIFMASVLYFGASYFVNAQDTTATETVADSTEATEKADVPVEGAADKKEDAAAKKTEASAAKTEESKKPEEPKMSFTQLIKNKIIDGGVEFMGIVLICLILGLTVAIEKVITLNLSTTNVKKLLGKLKPSVEKGDYSGAREIAQGEKGPVASIISSGLQRDSEGIDGIEKTIEAYGSAEITKLEKGMSWISLFISLAPMFGFMGTVIGMIDAFGTIKNSADIKISEVAGGIETALLTTAAGLIVAVILQIFYNYCQAKIEDITSQLEEGSNQFVGLVAAREKTVKK